MLETTVCRQTYFFQVLSCFFLLTYCITLSVCTIIQHGVIHHKLLSKMSDCGFSWEYKMDEGNQHGPCEWMAAEAKSPHDCCTVLNRSHNSSENYYTCRLLKYWMVIIGMTRQFGPKSIFQQPWWNAGLYLTLVSHISVWDISRKMNSRLYWSFINKKMRISYLDSISTPIHSRQSERFYISLCIDIEQIIFQ